MLRRIMAMVMGTACVLGAPAVLANLIQNGDFSDGLQHWHASSASAINVRDTDDAINTGTGPYGFGGFFSGDFVVLGDRRGDVLSHSGPDEGSFELRSSVFTLEQATRLQVNFRAVLDGRAGDRTDYFQVAIIGADHCPPFLLTLLKEFLIDDGWSGDPYVGGVDLAAGDYRLLVRLYEAHGHRSNSAVGIGEVSVEIGSASEVPLPAPAILLASALTSLLMRRRRAA